MPTPRPVSLPTSPKDLRPRYGLAAASAPSASPIPTPGSPFFKRRASIYAGGFAVITIAGTLIGASLKSSEQAEDKKVVKQKVTADVGEQIAILEETKTGLLQRKRHLELKIAEVREREVKEVELKREREELRQQGNALKRQMAFERTRD